MEESSEPGGETEGASNSTQDMEMLTIEENQPGRAERLFMTLITMHWSNIFLSRSNSSQEAMNSTQEIANLRLKASKTTHRFIPSKIREIITCLMLGLDVRI